MRGKLAKQCCQFKTVCYLTKVEERATQGRRQSLLRCRKAAGWSARPAIWSRRRPIERFSDEQEERELDHRRRSGDNRGGRKLFRLRPRKPGIAEGPSAAGPGPHTGRS